MIEILDFISNKILKSKQKQFFVLCNSHIHKPTFISTIKDVLQPNVRLCQLCTLSFYASWTSTRMWSFTYLAAELENPKYQSM